MRCYYLNSSIDSIISRKLQEKNETHQFDYIIDINNQAIHNRVFKNYEKLSTKRTLIEIYEYHVIEH